MGFVVKNTTSITLLDLICPHYCRGCRRLGQVLCECCKKNLLSQKIALKDGVWVCGWREELLGQLVSEYKFQSVRAIGTELGKILAAQLPNWQNITVVPLPTVAAHIRARGLDHSWQIAQTLAQLRRWRCQKILSRQQNTIQVGSNRQQRLVQSKKAYRVTGTLSATQSYLLLDDVWTTGASMTAAAELLEKAGAKNLKKVVLVKSR